MMRLKGYWYLGLVVLILTGCSKDKALAQDGYKGAPKHSQPDISVMPKLVDYAVGSSMTGPLKDTLDQTVRQLFRLTGMPGITAAILVPGKGMWRCDTGFISQPDNKKVDTNTVFYWASVGKLITATIIEQLIGEQKLKADSKLSEWFPQFQNSGKISIAQLLNHTSGLNSFNIDPKAFLIDQYYSPEELIRSAVKQKNLFAPGDYWSYSNTGYLLLAMIAEKVEQKTYAQIVQQRISAPLKLHSLHALEPRENPENLALAHENGTIVKEDYSVPLGAGNIVSNAADMLIFLQSLITGQLNLTSDTYSRLCDLYPMADKGSYYGQGIMLTDFKEINNTNNLWIGHSGGTQTYRALLIYDTNTRSFLAVSINQHISTEAIAMKLLSKIKF